MSPALLVLPVALAISGLLWSHMNCELFFYFWGKKNDTGILTDIEMNLWITLGVLCTF